MENKVESQPISEQKDMTLEQIQALPPGKQDTRSGNGLDQDALARELENIKKEAFDLLKGNGDQNEVKNWETEKALTQAPGCWKGWLDNTHILGLFFNFGLWIWLAVMLLCLMVHGADDEKLQLQCNNYPTYSGQTPDGFCHFCAVAGPTNMGGWGVFISLYFLYILESFLCHSGQFLAGLKPIEYAYDRYLKSRGSKPSISWHVVCYHYETRTRTVYDSNGRASTETYQVRVNTHFANDYFYFDTWNDLAQNFPINLELAKLRFLHQYTFDDEYTRNIYIKEKEKFIKDNRKDEFQDFWETYHVDRISPILAYNHGKLPERLRLTWYVLASFLMWSVFFRFWLSSLTTRHKLYMLKSIGRIPRET